MFLLAVRLLDEALVPAFSIVWGLEEVWKELGRSLGTSWVGNCGAGCDNQVLSVFLL